MYVFECSKGHKSYSASKAQYDPSCPECGDPTHIVGEDPELNESLVRELLDPSRKSPVIIVKKVFGQETSRNWSPDQQINDLFLRTVLNFMADRLKTHGHLFLNEVFDQIGLARTRQGQLVGWTYSADAPKKLYWEYDISSEEPDIAMMFFPEGEIIDKIEEES